MNLKIFRWLAVAIIAMCSQTIFCQEGTEYGRIVFQVVDAKGNKDTVIYCIKDDATEGIDEKLGEVNLYGQEPKGDLDIRLIQRTDKNCTDYGTDVYWLCPSSACRYYDWYFHHFGITPSKDNLDLKINYTNGIDFADVTDKYKFAIQIYAKNYPVTITAAATLNKDLGTDKYSILAYTLFEADGQQVASMPTNLHSCYDAINFSVVENDTVITFKNESENKLLSCNYVIQSSSFIQKEETKTKKAAYPNPSKDFITIEEGKIGEQFDIVNVDGKTIRSVIIESYPFQFDVSGLAKGTYYLKNQKGSEISKFVKE